MKCREPLVETTEVLTALGFPHDPSDLPQIYKAVGCPACSSTGYRGRVALHEVMTVSEEIESLVVTRATGSEIRQVALEQGMVSLRDDGWSKVAQGLTTIEEVLRVSVYAVAPSSVARASGARRDASAPFVAYWLRESPRRA